MNGEESLIVQYKYFFPKRNQLNDHEDFYSTENEKMEA